MSKDIQLWVQWKNQDGDNPQRPQDWTLHLEGNRESQADLAKLLVEQHRLSAEGNKVRLTGDLDVDIRVA